ncbi:cell division protein [Candidatus Endobugula sertula]|uniref:Peptidoglycan D,D-transpeptidase FtsI n=1 Tax=Candidatus Endobugula sertula TaxID=62101 RepID=A0A1D2QTR5_9GAMM|nr:cell division protein [Candidatus Endobugula sertula]
MKAKMYSVKIYRWRFYGVYLMLIVLTMALLWRLSKLQIIPNEHRGFEFLQEQGTARTLRTEKIPAHRGVITDRYGKYLAVSTPVVSLWADPRKLLTAEEQWSLLADSLNMDRIQLKDKLKRYSSKKFMYLSRQLDPSDAERILRHNIKGVYGRQEYKRFYPAGEVAAHVVGFTNIDDQGQEGLEFVHERWLAGTSGERQVLKDLSGRTIKDVDLLKQEVSGKDLALSIDLRIQSLAYRELKTAVKAHAAKAGSVVLLDARNGGILAMVNQPSYNPNDRRQLDPNALPNRAITDPVEPASTVKPLTMMVALESGRFSLNSTIDTNPGYFRVGRKDVTDPVNYGVMDLTKIITKSSQVGITKVALDLDGSEIREMFFRLGFGQSVGIGVPSESIGVLPNYKNWLPIDQASFSYGYGLSVTIVQLAQAYSVIANGGVKKPVSILKLDNQPDSSRVVDKKIAQQIVGMLETVVKPGGTATKANLESYTSAGKTGTVRILGVDGDYDGNSHSSLFVGFAPTNNPRIIAAIAIHEPSRGKYYGGEVAAPVFARVAKRSLQLLQTPPANLPLKDSKVVRIKKVSNTQSVTKKVEPLI